MAERVFIEPGGILFDVSGLVPTQELGWGRREGVGWLVGRKNYKGGRDEGANREMFHSPSSNTVVRQSIYSIVVP